MRLFPDGTDVDFVGHYIIKRGLVSVRRHGWMAVCGQIGAYNGQGEVPGPPDFALVLMRQLRIEGFLIIDVKDRRQAYGDPSGWITGGDMQWPEHVVPGLENAVDALNLLFARGRTTAS